MVRWLERNGYDVSYTSEGDVDRDGSSLLEHKVFLSVGHDEYWSGGQRANVTAARDAGVNLGFFSGNEIFWKTRWENSHRTLVCYKETHANEKIDPEANVWTGTWRDPRFGAQDGKKPENELSGTIFMVDEGTTAIEVPAADGKLRLWRNTNIASLEPGETATLAGEHARVRVGRRPRQRLPAEGPVSPLLDHHRSAARSSKTSAQPTGRERRRITSRSTGLPAARWSSARERSSGPGASKASMIAAARPPTTGCARRR